MSTQILRELRFLRAYALLTMPVLVVLSVSAFRAMQNHQFEEINAERINIVEQDGTIRLVLSNMKRSPAPVVRGKSFGPAGVRPGMIFYNAEGTEVGGLAFDSKTENGTYSAGGILTFDQYEQDQVVSLQYIDNNGKRYQGLTVLDRPDVSYFEVLEREEAIRQMADGPEQDQAWKELSEFQGGVPYGAQRLFVGRDTSKAAVVSLSDRFGKPRLRFTVDSAGGASIAFLDENGGVTYSLPEGE
ncbi:MAG: hypothetical protein HKM89_15585 [Gemmatimonadales bacterium]|nr:hypothetical protein [Gemmatimonadales bacterium]